jgi:hypothetical protein
MHDRQKSLEKPAFIKQETSPMQSPLTATAKSSILKQ